MEEIEGLEKNQVQLPGTTCNGGFCDLTRDMSRDRGVTS